MIIKKYTVWVVGKPHPIFLILLIAPNSAKYWSKTPSISSFNEKPCFKHSFNEKSCFKQETKANQRWFKAT